jgi:hypothetical protein
MLIGDLQPRWLREVNAAMDLPLPDARRVLDEVINERRERATELRTLADDDNVTDMQRRAYTGMATWVDESVALVAQAAARLTELDASGRVATGREQIKRELHAQSVDHTDSEGAPPACAATDAATGGPCAQPGVLWRAIRGRLSIEAVDWRVCTGHATGPITVCGREYADEELTRPRSDERTPTDAHDSRERARGRSL